MPRKIELSNVIKNNDDTYSVEFPDGFNYYGIKTFKTEAEANKLKEEWNRNNIKYGSEQGVKFKSSHFDEPNILAHVRYNERTVNGERV